MYSINKDKKFFTPAVSLDKVVDPTGAGDTFAGGFIGHLEKTKNTSFENMKKAVICGSAMASFSVEKFGTKRIKEITHKDIERRLQKFIKLVQFEV